jgi:hypothetical protein
MDIKIKVGSLDILSSGSFQIERGKSFEFNIPDGDEPSLKLILFLTEDRGRMLYDVNSRLIDKNTLELSLANFDHPEGTGGLNSPIKIGTWRDQTLYFSFYLSCDYRIMPLFNYTFYI